MCNQVCIEIPDLSITLYPGSKIKLGRFETTTWILFHGWYSIGGNRPICGWYMSDFCNPGNVRSLQKSDLDDIYLVE